MSAYELHEAAGGVNSVLGDDEREEAAEAAVARYIGEEPDADGRGGRAAADDDEADEDDGADDDEEDEDDEPKARTKRRTAKGAKSKGAKPNREKTKPGADYHRGDEGDDEDAEDRPSDADEDDENEEDDEPAGRRGKGGKERRTADSDTLDVDAIVKLAEKHGLFDDDDDEDAGRLSPARQAPPQSRTVSERGKSADGQSADDEKIDPFAPLLDEHTLNDLSENYDREVAEVFRKIHKRDQARTEMLRELVGVIRDQMRDSLLEKAQAVNATFRELVADERFAKIYGTNPRQLTKKQDKARANVLTIAVRIKKALADGGEYVSLQDAIRAAHAGLHRNEIEAAAEERGRRSVEEQLIKRSRQRDLVPGSMQRRPEPAKKGDAAAVQAVAAVLKKYGLDS